MATPQRYGLTYVDFRDQKRMIKGSGLWYGRVAGANYLDVSYISVPFYLRIVTRNAIGLEIIPNSEVTKRTKLVLLDCGQLFQAQLMRCGRQTSS